MPEVTAFENNHEPPTPTQQAEGSESQTQKLAQVLVLVGGLSIAAAGLLGGSASLLIAALGPAEDRLTMATVSISFLSLSLGLGLALAWQAGQAIARRRSGPFQPRHAWAAALLFVTALLLGQLMLSLDLAPALTFPLFHVIAAILPPLVILALLGRYLTGAARWRDVVLQVGSGAFLSTSAAFMVEFTVILGALVALLTVVAIRPGGQELLQALAARLQDPTWLPDPTRLLPLFKSPLVLAGAWLLFAGAVPLIEETVKTLGVGLLAYRRPTLPEAVVWGAASGAGFALTEALFNSISGLDIWAGVVLLRVGASLLHCLCGGWMGLAWYHLLREQHWRRALGLYAASVSVHGLWNSLAGAMALFSLSAIGQEAPRAWQGAVGLGNFVILGLFCLLSLGLVFGLAGLARYAQRHGPAMA